MRESRCKETYPKLLRKVAARAIGSCRGHQSNKDDDSVEHLGKCVRVKEGTLQLLDGGLFMQQSSDWRTRLEIVVEQRLGEERPKGSLAAAFYWIKLLPK